MDLLVRNTQDDLHLHADDIKNRQAGINEKIGVETMWKAVGLVLTVVIACWTAPGTTFVLKGNPPLELRPHPRRKAVLYASGPAYLDAVPVEENG